MSGERSRSSFAHDPRVDLNPEMSIEMEPMTAARNQTPTFVGKVAFTAPALALPAARPPNAPVLRSPCWLALVTGGCCRIQPP